MWQSTSVFDQQMERRFGPGETVFRAGDTVTHVFLVRTGLTALVRPLPSGEQACLQRASTGDLVAEASVYATQYHCDCVALEPTALAQMPIKTFRDVLRCDVALAEAWAAHLARTVQRARMLAEIRSLKTVSARLDAWIGEYGAIPSKGQWQVLASELSVSREALYRELARRRAG